MKEKKKLLVKNLYLIIILIFVFLLITYIGLRIWFKSEITEICDNAMSKYQGDKIEALVLLAISDSNSLKERNNAIWALGKLRDKRAIPALESLKTDSLCDHSKYVCQREIRKALDNLEGKSIDILTFK